MFSCAPGDHLIAPLLAEAVTNELKNPGRDKLVVFSATDHDSRMAAKEILRALSVCHCMPDFKLEFPAGVTSFDPQLSGLGTAKPHAVLIIAGPEDSARLVVAIRERLGDVLIFGTHQMGRFQFCRLAGKAAENARFPLLWKPDKSDVTTRKFIENFKARYGREPDYAAALSYDATRLLVAAARQGGLSRAGIRGALVKLSPWQGIAGSIQWDGTGQNSRKVTRMGTIRNGCIVPGALPLHGNTSN
jgi:ABC-type branched-subunit amino acid transport system substrate-binding protein